MILPLRINIDHHWNVIHQMNINIRFGAVYGVQNCIQIPRSTRTIQNNWGRLKNQFCIFFFLFNNESFPLQVLSYRNEINYRKSVGKSFPQIRSFDAKFECTNL